MTIARPFLLLGASLLAACTTPGQSYASRHPELPAARRQVLVSGKIPNGDAVAGMTHEEVKLAMNGAPNTFDTIAGEEAWIYVRKKTAAVDVTEEGQPSSGPNSGRPVDLRTQLGDAELNADVKTTIFFHGEYATHAEISPVKP